MIIITNNFIQKFMYNHNFLPAFKVHKIIVFFFLTTAAYSLSYSKFLKYFKQKFWIH